MLLRRDLAPHLKSIMGPWWFSQFDLASEVSQAAKSSLQVGSSFRNSVFLVEVIFYFMCGCPPLSIINSLVVLLDQ